MKNTESLYQNNLNPSIPTTSDHTSNKRHWLKTQGRYEYLIRRSGPLKKSFSALQKAITANSLSPQNFEQLSEQEIYFLEAKALDRADELEEKKKKSCRFYSGDRKSKTYHEQILTDALIDLLPQAIQPHIYPKYPEGAQSSVNCFDQISVGPYIPDLMLLGFRGCGKKNITGTIFEADGEIHDRDEGKMKKDDERDDLLKDFGLITIRFTNEQLRTKAVAYQTVSSFLSDPKLSKALVRKSARDKLRHRIAVRTIATYLTLEESDQLLANELGRVPSLAAGLQLVLKNRRTCPKVIRDAADRGEL